VRRKATKNDSAVRMAATLNAEGRAGVEKEWEETDDFHEKWRIKAQDVLARSEFRRRKLLKRCAAVSLPCHACALHLQRRTRGSRLQALPYTSVDHRRCWQCRRSITAQTLQRSLHPTLCTGNANKRTLFAIAALHTCYSGSVDMSGCASNLFPRLHVLY
jgi:hypothetical protein